jgi:K+-sensing histidine kinase KdpD
MTNIPLPAHLDLEQFVSEQTHDLRSPFNQIVGFSKMLLNDPSPTYPLELQKEDASTVYRNGQRALLMMNGLIDIARLNRHEKEANPAEVEIESLLEQSLAYWRRFNPASILQTENQVSTSTSHLYADEMLLRQTLFSFIMVVAQYVDPQGTVTITAEEEPEWFVFKVAGTGKKAQPSSQLDLQMQGYLGRAMVELQQGEIRLAEEADDGASIQFALPKV